MAVERVVYILGAGFSAPLGLPVVSNFLFRAKDLFAGDPNGLAYFKDVFEEIDSLARVKNYFSADLFDIEEILSILEMRSQFGGSNLPVTFSRFICEVVTRSTPPASTPSPRQHQAEILDSTSNRVWAGYVSFVAALSNVFFWGTTEGDTYTEHQEPLSEPAIRYDVVSLNYDLVLESAAAALRNTGFARTHTEADQHSQWPRLVKLHGCVSDGAIVPPTWRKALTTKMTDQWDAARSVLSRANEIRILGYSLPRSDAYIKFLLKAAASEAPNLRAIDIITVDSDGVTEQRFREFISFRETNFVSGDIGQYLQRVALPWGKVDQTRMMKGAQRSGFGIDLERVHEAFMSRSR